MKPELQQDDGTQARTRGESTSQQKYRRALRALAVAYERIMADLAEEVCDSEEAIMAGGHEFLLGELENKFVHRIRDLQTLIGSLRNQIQTQAPTVLVDELRCKQEDMQDTIAAWLSENPSVELVQVLTLPVESDVPGEVLVLPLYYGTPS